jgi:hypothetical protein
MTSSVKEIFSKHPKAIIAVAVVVVIIIVVVYLNYNKSEHFRENTNSNINPEIYSGVPMRPEFKALISPRFDANGMGGNPLLGNATMPPMAYQAAPVQPVGGAIPQKEHFVDFSSMGSSSAPVPSGALTSDQVNNMLDSRSGSKSPEMQDTKDLMPVPDMSYSAGVDPTDPQSFMYDRTIFSRLKRRYGNGVDFFRGDIDVSPEYRGWFDVQPPTDVDIVQGYFDRYIDIQQETAIKDATFTRATPVEQLFKNSINPFGDTNKTAYHKI